MMDYEAHDQAVISGLEQDLAAARAEIERLTKERDEALSQIEGYKEWGEDVKRLTRQLDVEMHGDGAAKQASLCDLIGAGKDLKDRAEKADAERDLSKKLLRSCIKGNTTLREKAQKTIAERDESRAQVATAYASGWKDGNHPDADQMPADAKSALEAYGREKEREGMKRAAEVCGIVGAGASWIDCRDAILAEMEALK